MIKIIKKIITIIKIKFKYIFIDLFIIIAIFFYKLKIYLPGIESIYMRSVFKLYNSSNIEKANKFAKFFFEKKNKFLIANDFMSVILRHSGDKSLGTEINNFSEQGRHILRKIYSSEEFILVEPGAFRKFGHMFFLEAFIKAIRLDLIDAKKIIITGDLKNYHAGALSLFSNCKEIIVDENFYKKKENKKYTWINQLSLNSIRSKNGKYDDIHVFWNKINQSWKAKINKPIFTIDEKKLERCVKYYKDIYRIDIEVDPFILLHVRENKYEKYSNLRNANIENYKSVIEFLNQKKINVIRIGDKNMRDLNISSSKYVDIRNDPNQENHIIFLAYLSKFQLTTNSGPMMLNVSLNKPNIYTDYIPLKSVMGNDGDMIVPKMIFDEKNKIVDVNKRFNNDFGTNESSVFYNNKKFRIKDNSHDLIKNSVIEMYEKVILNKKPILTENQKKYIEISKKKEIFPLIISREVEKYFPDFFIN